MTMFDREVFFDNVRGTLFGGSLNQGQVDGMNAVLSAWEAAPLSDDLRHLAYPLATDKHETANTMLPIEEYGKGAGRPYGKPDPMTGKAYYGRGYVQLTWADNYKRATEELGLTANNDLYWHPEKALDHNIAAEVMFRGMSEGWFRKSHNLARYFSDTVDDPYNAREIINGDKSTVPSWSNGVSIGNIIKGYHQKFLKALELAADAYKAEVFPEEPVDRYAELEKRVAYLEALCAAHLIPLPQGEKK